MSLLVLFRDSLLEISLIISFITLIFSLFILFNCSVAAAAGSVCILLLLWLSENSYRLEWPLILSLYLTSWDPAASYEDSMYLSKTPTGDKLARLKMLMMYSISLFHVSASNIQTFK